MLFWKAHAHFLFYPVPIMWYSRHEAEFGARLHALPLLDIVGWDDAFTAHLVLGFVPVGVLVRGQPRHILRSTLPCKGTKPRRKSQRWECGVGI